MANPKALVACALAALLVSGCGGGGAKVETTTTTVSIGQQLIDLKKARDTGAITQAQYDRAKQDLINRVLSN